jgi:hypothetical protein
LWLAIIVGGSLILAREEFTPVQALAQGKTFPAGSAIPLSSFQPTLILFVHPLCPCTRASFHELEDLLAEVPNKVSVVVVFTIPEGLPSDWKKGDLWQSAMALSGIHVMQDDRGIESRRFNVTGSGHCLLYSPSGALLFSGGITASRGHDGENPGRLALVSLISTGRADIHGTPVFGCSLL